MSFTTQLPAAQEYVYVIHATGTNRIKLGFSTKPKERLAQLQTGSPFPLQMLACWPGSRARENRLHRYMAQFRQVGEWFEVPPFIGLKLWELVHKGEVTGSVKKTTYRTVGERPQSFDRNARRYDKTDKPCVEATRASANTWYIRLRWNQRPGRPVQYCCTLTSREYEHVKSVRWLQYKQEIIEKYAGDAAQPAPVAAQGGK